MMMITVLNFTFLYFSCFTFGVGTLGIVAVAVGCGSALGTLGSAGNAGVSLISGSVVTWKFFLAGLILLSGWCLV